MRKPPSIAPLLVLALLVLPGIAGAAEPARERPGGSSASSPRPATTQDLEARLKAAVRGFDEKGLVALTAEVQRVLAAKEEFPTLLLMAKSHLARCDLRRFMRKTYDLEKARDKEYRTEESTLAEEGCTYAEKALAIYPQSSEALRVQGELYIHQITGPIAGFRFGPKGRQAIEQAIKQDSRNAEARRAIGLMYLYNPAINGGDPKKAAETFDTSFKMGGDDRHLVLAARAYEKLEDYPTAAERLQEALKLNPNNLEAQELLKGVQAKASEK